MRTNRFLSTLVAAIAGGLISLLIYSHFFNKNQIIYQYSYPPAKLASFSGTGQQAVDLTYAAAQTVHGVVHVRTKSKVETTYRNPIYEFFYGDGTITRSEPVMGFGSGVIISSDGYIVTNNHVIKNADEISVKLNDNREFEARLVSTDPSTDIALLKIDGENFPFIPFGNSDDLKLGEWVLAVGNPYNLNSTVTAGIVSAKARDLNLLDDNYKIESFIQTDAALNPGNSGGALVNVKGELVGINTAIMSPTGGYSGNSFAIPVTIVKKVVEDLKEYGAVQRAFLGITPVDVNADLAKQHNLSVTKGVYVNNVKETGAAKEVGIKEGDIIIRLNNIEIENTSELQEQLSKFRPNDKIDVVVLRDAKEQVFKVLLRNLQGETTLVKPTDVVSIMGAKLSELTELDKQKLGIKYGVKITALSAGKFSKVGIEEGFIITRMNNKPVSSVKDLKSILENTRGGVYIEGIYPSGVVAYYAFGL